MCKLFGTNQNTKIIELEGQIAMIQKANIKLKNDNFNLIQMFLKAKQELEALPDTIEEIIANSSIDMTDSEKAQYWYEVSQTAFALLGKVEVPIFEISSAEWVKVATAQYPTLKDIKLSDDVFYTTTQEGLQLILNRDWTNLVPYLPNKSDCDKFDNRLYDHLHTYYGLTGIKPVWGDSTAGYHGYNLGVLKSDDVWIARLIEPQTDLIFVDRGSLGVYLPRETVMQEAILH